MKDIYKIFTILAIGLVVLSCGSPINNTKTWDGSDNSSSSLLKAMPSLDISDYDLSVEGVTRSADEESTVGNWSEGAGFAKGLRNKSIRLSKKSEYLADLIKLLDLVFTEFNLGEGVHYFKPDSFTLPFDGEGIEGAIIRVVVSGDKISTELAFNQEVMIQVYVDGGDDNSDSTQVVEVWQHLKYDGDDFEKQWIKVDNTNSEKIEINFKLTGLGSAGDDTVFDYNYLGYLEDNTESDTPYNIAEGSFSESFTGGENFAYQLRYSSKFNQEYGTTFAVQEFPEDDPGYFGPESWSLESNKIVDPEVGETYSSEFSGLLAQDLPSIDISTGLTVSKIEKDWATSWDGKLPTDATVIDLIMSFIPEENLPTYESWDKYEDLTTFTERKGDYTAEFAEID